MCGQRMNMLLAIIKVPGLFKKDKHTTHMTQCKENTDRQGLKLDFQIQARTLAAPTVRLTTLTRRGQGGMLPGNVTDVLPLDVTPLYPGFSNNTKK